ELATLAVHQIHLKMTAKRGIPKALMAAVFRPVARKVCRRPQGLRRRPLLGPGDARFGRHGTAGLNEVFVQILSLRLAFQCLKTLLESDCGFFTFSVCSNSRGMRKWWDCRVLRRQSTV